MAARIYSEFPERKLPGGPSRKTKKPSGKKGSVVVKRGFPVTVKDLGYNGY